MQRFRKPQWMLALVLWMNASQILAQTTPTIELPETLELPRAQSNDLPSAAEIDLQNIVDDLDLSENPLSFQEEELASALSQRVSTTEWLGALGPVAISPFFGLTCLSGIAIMFEDRLPEGHFLRRASSPLRNPLVFLTFLVLTVLTSLPRFSKVSKPFAQAMDQLETYSAIVILLVIRFMGSMDVGGSDPQMADVVFQAGIFEFSMETLLTLATVVNLIVVNAVKFFFEVLIWITPVPFIDAIFEAASKTCAAALAAIYAFNPAIATAINLLIVAACLVAFAWVKRREVYYRTVLFDFVKHWWQSDSSSVASESLRVFPKTEFEGVPAMSRCELSRSRDGWHLRVPRWFRPAIEKTWSDRAPVMKSGLLMSTMQVGDTEFRFGKRSAGQLSALATQLGGQFDGGESLQRPPGNLAAEMA